VVIVLFFSLAAAAYGQKQKPVLYPDDPFFLKNQFIPKTYHPEHISKKPGHYTITDWDEAIDNTWGWGLTKDQKLDIFDTFWQLMDESFACFVEMPGYYPQFWGDQMRLYRSEIENGDPTYGVSRGRFAAIMNYLSMALVESHTNAQDIQVCWNTFPDPGVPLLVCGAWGTEPFSGAGLTPLDDNTLLVYKTVENHPLGLEPGDRVLGYDGVPWTELYHELLTAQLPLIGWWWGSSEYTFDYSFMVSAGMNWHLFDTIDILKYSTGETVHLSTTLMADFDTPIQITEQVDVPGVPIPDMEAGERVKFGIINGTQIGYIYVMSWTGPVEVEFYNALATLMNDYETTGLIIDYRTNYGGWFVYPLPGYSLLYNTRETTVNFGGRCSPDDQLSMCPFNYTGWFVIPGNSSNYYDRPIAVLVGPGAVSVGDQAPRWIKSHPMVRLFGRPTAGAYTSVADVDLGYVDWACRYTPWNTFIAGDPDNYLTHSMLEIDEDVWLAPDDVAQGHDTVVEAAETWINSFTGLQPEIAYNQQDIEISVEYGQTAIQDLTLQNIGSRHLFYSLTPQTDNRLWLESDKDNSVIVQMLPREIDPLILEGSFKPGAEMEPQFPPVISGHGGPDAYGYIWTDSDQPYGPEYQWIDISVNGTIINLGDDSFSGPFSLGFDFPFYGNTYSSLYVGSNGLITFGSGSSAFNNVGIPSYGPPNNFIAPWWDDLNPTAGGQAYYYWDEISQRFIVSFVGVPKYNYGGSLTFQAVLYPDGQIDLNYSTMERVGPGSTMLAQATIGIENSDGTDGLEVVYDAQYVHDNLSIKIMNDWIGISPCAGYIAPGESASASIAFNAGNFPPGSYSGIIHLECNDPDEPSITIPVSLTVTTCGDYVVGDFNNSGAFNVVDIVGGYSKLKTDQPEPGYICNCPFGSGDLWAVSMDVNNSCEFNIADIVDGFSKLKTGLPELLPCQDCPPPGREPGPRDKGRLMAAPLLKTKANALDK